MKVPDPARSRAVDSWEVVPQWFWGQPQNLQDPSCRLSTPGGQPNASNERLRRSSLWKSSCGGRPRITPNRCSVKGVTACVDAHRMLSRRERAGVHCGRLATSSGCGWDLAGAELQPAARNWTALEVGFSPAYRRLGQQAAGLHPEPATKGEDRDGTHVARAHSLHTADRARSDANILVSLCRCVAVFASVV